MVNKDVY